MNPGTVHIALNAREGWMIELPDECESIVCETLDDAQRVAYLCATQRHPCGLVVRDAYHRVLYRMLGSRDGDTDVGRDTLGEERPEAASSTGALAFQSLRSGAD